MNDITLLLGDCLDRMAEIPDGTVDAIITDPPYPEIDRPYGRMTEAEWHLMMRGVVAESRRVLAPRGSAVFVLQPNSERVGRMRPWLWEFMAWTAREWNMVQDAWWWNWTALPVGGATTHDLLRASLKACVWLGEPDCYRDRPAVAWEESESNKVGRAAAKCHRVVYPSGRSVNPAVARAAAVRNGGVSPFNVIPCRNDFGHGATHSAATPEPLCGWWIRYITRPDDTVLDPFMGSGTVGLAAWKRRRRFIGIERDPGYFATARRRLDELQASVPLLAGLEATA